MAQLIRIYGLACLCRCIGVRPSSIISARFFVALFVLSASLVAVGVLGLRGLQDVQHANDQVFADNLVTAEASSRLALDLANAERIGLGVDGE
ncbi:MAG: Tar ligand binding domain-containing protein [Solirubrobacteraceae bacterium]